MLLDVVLKKILESHWTARRSNQHNLKEISTEYSLEGPMLKQKLQYLATWCEELTHWKGPSTTHTTHRDLMNYNKVNLPLREGSTLNVATRQSDSRVFQTDVVSLVLDKWSLRSETLWRSPFPCCFPLLFPFEFPHHLPLCVCGMPVFKKGTITERWELPQQVRPAVQPTLYLM